MATQRLGVLLLSMVCDKLDIPFTVKLHRTNYYHDSDYVSEVKLDVVHSFNDKKVDYEKILSIESGGANRDGLAFAYHLKELESRKEEHKVFFIWSDGEPADTGYMGSEAVKDIQNIKQIKIIELEKMKLQDLKILKVKIETAIENIEKE